MDSFYTALLIGSAGGALIMFLFLRRRLSRSTLATLVADDGDYKMVILVRTDINMVTF